MEIVPILSTIILVGTVATFILAVAAYVLYKMREGGAQESELEMERELHHVVMAVNQSEGMYGGDSGPAEAPMYFTPTETAPPSGEHFAGMNNPGGSQASQPDRTRTSQPAADDQFQGQPLNAFFWEYSEEGFAPINVHDGPERNQRNQQMAIDPDNQVE